MCVCVSVEQDAIDGRAYEKIEKEKAGECRERARRRVRDRRRPGDGSVDKERRGERIEELKEFKGSEVCDHESPCMLHRQV